jgi:hypothetical protein
MQLKSHRTVEQIAKKHRMNVSDIRRQLDMGVPIEHEHTRNKTLATDIALQHLDEIPDYYTRLKKMEASAKKDHKKFKDVKEDAVTDLQRGITELPDASYGSIDGLMRRIMKKRRMSAEQLHNDFVDKHNQTPDTWAKKNMKEETGLWDNIHARREKGLPRKKPGQKGYPKTLKIEEGLKQARKNVGASKCWPGKVTKGTKIKNGKEVPNCVPVTEASEMKRYCPKCAKEETRNECKYGQKYWDMFSMPITLKDYTPNTPHPGNFPESYDHEHSMARSELSTIVSAAKRLRGKLKGEGNIEAWVQSKITKAADYLDAAADYIDSGESKVNEDITIEDANGNAFLRIIDIIKADRLVKEGKEGISFGVGDTRLSSAQEKLSKMTPEQRSQLPSRMVKKLIGADLPPFRSSPSSMVKTADSYEPERKPFSRFMSEASPAWQRKAGKNPEGGLNKKGIASYRKQHPGSNLSLAVTTDPSELKSGSKKANRRKSFCSRMSGMKAKLTSAKTANDPNSRINKSLRKWNC